MRRLLDALLVAIPAAVLMLIPLILGGQQVPLDSGVRVRISGRVTRGIATIARVVETRADTLVLDDGTSRPLVLLARDLDVIEVEHQNSAREGAMAVGVAAGLAGGTALAVNMCRGHGTHCWILPTDENGDGDTSDDEDGLLPGVGTLTIGLVGLAGGALGALLTPSRWKRVGGAAAQPVRIGLRGARRGLGLMVSFPFGGPARAHAVITR